MTADTLDLPHTLAHGSRQELAAALSDARQHTLGLLDALVAALPPGLELRVLPELSPPRWLLAELAWAEDWWIARHPLRRLGPQASPDTPRSAAPLPRLDAAVAPGLSHASRWHQDVPDLPTLRSLLAASRQRTLALLATTPQTDDALHPYRQALRREDELRLLLLTICQTLGLAPGPLAASPLPCPAAADDLDVPAATHHFGAPPTGQHPAHERPAFELALHGFAIDLAPINWARFLPFIEAGGYEEPRWWTPEGWAWVRRQNLLRPRHLSRSDDGHWLLAQFGQWVPLDPRWPALFLSRHEALAWCRWAGRRLPSELEWEAAARLAADDLPDSAADTRTPPFSWGQALEWTLSDALPWAAVAAATNTTATESVEPFTTEPGDAPTWPAGLADEPLVSLRGAGPFTAPRLATPWTRHSAPPGWNAWPTGFRSCAPLADGVSAVHVGPAPDFVHHSALLAAPRPPRKRAAPKRPPDSDLLSTGTE
ncbi:SUMF1/EgtB/PvdO family nonheme iron enzyme [Ideonella margarita]|uniref:SUMF1/EgtB/PvdO family nonheme iron enzyme n=1 Tax=Ideonella margarita TaxID=2984191 RepID=A0ABU9C859_9BURK